MLIRSHSLITLISIHALLAESDRLGLLGWLRTLISIHALLAESDARRASRQQPAGISIHALLAESDFSPKPKDKSNRISIHALLAESDAGTHAQWPTRQDFYPRSPCGERQWTPLNSPVRCYFYPRSPCGERQALDISARRGASISIHALLAESDFGEINTRGSEKVFLSTLSLRRATVSFA